MMWCGVAEWGSASLWLMNASCTTFSLPSLITKSAIRMDAFAKGLMLLNARLIYLRKVCWSFGHGVIMFQQGPEQHQAVPPHQTDDVIWRHHHLRSDDASVGCCFTVATAQGIRCMDKEPLNTHCNEVIWYSNTATHFRRKNWDIKFTSHARESEFSEALRRNYNIEPLFSPLNTPAFDKHLEAFQPNLGLLWCDLAHHLFSTVWSVLDGGAIWVESP